MSKLRRVLFLTSNEYSSWGGSEELWGKTAERLAQQGVEVSILRRRFADEPRQIRRLVEVGCKIFYWDPPSLAQRVARRLLPLADREARLLQSVCGNSTDLVVISQGNLTEGWRWMQACRAMNQRYAVIAHSVMLLLWPSDDAAEQIATNYQAAAAAYFISNANIRLSRRQLASELTNAKLVRNPFKVNYDANPPWPGDAGKELSLACVGALYLNSKGQDMLVDVLSSQPWRDRAVSVTCYGEGYNRRGLEYCIRKAGLNNVRLAGFVDDIEEIWAKHHALISASHIEGMPISMVEAMLCGRACIGTDVGGVSELIQDELNGFLAAAPTVSQIALAMERMWNRRGELRQMGQKAAEHIRNLVPRDPVAAFIDELERACA